MAKAKPRTNPEPEAPAPAGEYTVVARRYRPQQFAELVGQEPVAQALVNAIKSDRVAHAYLFTGARGVGKTSAARILAKALNCVKGPTPTPCDQCDICQSIASGEDIDVLEIDGASNRGIDEVRAIRQNVSTRPSRSRYKIYIIDEVHMLTPQAFNALLKTLEEPPPHVKFIFATTEVQKIPITILSRCQRFNFAGISSSKIVERLKQVVKAEGMQADDDALLIVARRGSGSMRDAQSLLEQLLAFGGERLTAEKVHQMLGTATSEGIIALVDAIVAKDARAAFELLGRFSEEGLQLGELLDQLIEYWRNLMVLNCAGKDFPDLSLAEAHREKIQQHAASVSIDSILAGLDILSASKSRLRGSSQALVLLETAVLKLIRLDEMLSVAQLAQWVSQPGAVPAAPQKTAASQGVSLSEAAKKNSVASHSPATNGKAPGAAPQEIVTQTNIVEIWAKLREKVGPMLGGILEVGRIPAIFGPKSLVLRFGLRYTSQYHHCSSGDSIKRIEAALREISGQEWNLRVEIDPAEAAAPSESATETTTGKTVTYREREQDVAKIPLVSRAMEKMGARLLKMDDRFGSTEPPSGQNESAPQQES